MIGDEWAKAGQELGRAGQEISKAAGKGLDAAQTAGGFFGKYLAGPLEETSGILTDRLRFIRWERQVRLARRAQQILAEHGLEAPNRKLPLSIGVPLIEAASLEEDDELQDLWAQLLANCGDADSGVRLKRSYITILQDMGSLEAKLLDRIANAPAEFRKSDRGDVLTAELPDKYLPYPSSDQDDPQRLPPPDTVVALWNLVRLGCVELVLTFGGMSARAASATPLGEEFAKAVSSKLGGPKG